jgi:hypothetical protein
MIRLSKLARAGTLRSGLLGMSATPWFCKNITEDLYTAFAVVKVDHPINDEAIDIKMKTIVIE